MKEVFVNVALNIPSDLLFTYKVPEHFKNSAEPGKRVLVNFGKRILTGIIVRVSDSTQMKNVKEIKSILDETRIMTEELMNFCNWISEYYLTPLGMVLFSTIPRNINIRSEKYYSLSENYRSKLDENKFSDIVIADVINIFESNGNKQLTSKQIERKLNFKDLKRFINLLTERGLLTEENYYSKPTREKIIKIIRKNFNTNDLTSLIKKHKIKSLKQIKVLEDLAESHQFDLNVLAKKHSIASSSINSLLSKDLILISEVRQMRSHDELYAEQIKTVELTCDQKKALSEIQKSLDDEKFKVFLLFGVTGSGKTEVYLNAIESVIKHGKNSIVLVPEISLTPQLIYRFKKRFGEIVGVIHSRISDGEKLDTYDRIKNGKYKIIIGARSAIFVPLKNIGMIIVDEEHDSSFKQDNAPRYNGRDAAVYRARLNNAVVVLGSATPSMESFYNGESGKYQILRLPQRATKINLPEIKILDLLKKKSENEENDKKDFFETIDNVRVKFLSKELIYEIGERLNRHESIIILQNRRGYHAYIECLSCGNVEMCIRCNVALTYHKGADILKCHYCGFSKRFQKICSACNSSLIIPKGAGTERVEEELKRIFPKAGIVRMDSDTLTSKKMYQQILKDFYEKKIDILTGTQMIAKGLDFPDVTLVGVINADIGLLNPDFRATEKTFQLLTQVAGRSGRSDKKGEVLIQTNHSDFYFFNDVKNHDYQNFFDNEIKIRKALNYPPFSRLIIIEVQSEDQRQAESKIKEIFNLLKKLDTESRLELLPPIQPLFFKLKDNYRYHLIIKSAKEKDQSGNYLKEILNNTNIYIKQNFPGKLKVIVDVDAINLL